MDAIGRIGLIIPEILDQIDYELVSGVFNQAKLIGYDVVIYTGVFNSMEEYQQDYYTHGLENIYSLIYQSRLDGIIFAAERFYNERVRTDIFNYLSLTDIPCLTLGYKYKDMPYMNAPQHDGAYEMTEHIIKEHQCKKIYCLAGVKDHEPSEERLQGVIDAAADNNITLEENNIFYGYYWKDVPSQIARDIAEERLEKPDAVICLSDLMAKAFIDEISRYGIKIPDDIAVTGYDGSWYAILHSPQITTVTGREKVFGEMAVCHLYEMITGEKCTCAGSKQRLRLGTSCGCTLREYDLDQIGISSPESYVSSQVEKMFDKKTFLATDYIDTLADADGVAELMLNIDKVSHILRGWKWIEICLCEDWQTDINNLNNFRKQGFSDKMYLGLSKRYGVNEKNGYYFNTADIIPALSKPHEPSIIALTSLHCKGQIFGYCAIRYDFANDIDLGEYHVRWCDAVTSGLNRLQKKLYKKHVHQQMEMFSTVDPLTKMLNKRGFLEELPDKLHTLKKQSAECRMMLVSWVHESPDSVFDASVVIANFLKNIPCELCARVSEKCFALIITADPEEIIAPLENEVSGFMWGTSAKPEIITEIEEITAEHPSELEKLLEEKLSGFAEKCSAAENSYESNRQILYKLRREIISQPEKEWNLTDISHDIGMSKTHLNRLYKSFFDISIKEEIINSRLERAKQLLRHTELRIQEIADRCGYQSESHFMRQFKEKTGITASAYRKN